MLVAFHSSTTMACSGVVRCSHTVHTSADSSKPAQTICRTPSSPSSPANANLPTMKTSVTTTLYQPFAER